MDDRLFLFKTWRPNPLLVLGCTFSGLYHLPWPGSLSGARPSVSSGDWLYPLTWLVSSGLPLGPGQQLHVTLAASHDRRQLWSPCPLCASTAGCPVLDEVIYWMPRLVDCGLLFPVDCRRMASLWLARDMPAIVAIIGYYCCLHLSWCCL